MRFFIPRLALFLVSITVGYFLLLMILPHLATQVYADRLPWAESERMKFVFFYNCFIQSMIVLVAVSTASMTGFFMRDHGWLRRITLTLPLWVPVTYGWFYILMMLK